MRNLFLYANYYYNMGFNITHIVPKVNQYKENCRNPFKSSTNDRTNLGDLRQDLEDLQTFNWNDAVGIGTVLGFNNLRALDFDGCSNIQFIQTVIEKLNLDKSYEWVVKSGSDNGFHILFYADMHNYLHNNDMTKAFIPNQNNILKFSRMELRWTKHLILPPSLSNEYKTYKFFNCDLPLSKPAFLAMETIEKLIEFLCVEEDGTSNVGSCRGITEYENEFLDFTPISSYDEGDEGFDDCKHNDYDSGNDNDRERDYFNAMTDGQLGDYDDFGGSMDDIDTWSRG
jgi:hypothetical protein